MPLDPKTLRQLTLLKDTFAEQRKAVTSSLSPQERAAFITAWEGNLKKHGFPSNKAAKMVACMTVMDLMAQMDGATYEEFQDNIATLFILLLEDVVKDL